MQIPIIVVGDVSGRYVSGIESQRGSISVVRHIHDLGEMLGLAQSGIARAVLLVTQYEDLTRTMLSTLQHLDIAICAVLDADVSPPFPQVAAIDALADIPQVLEGIEKAVEALESAERDPGKVDFTPATDQRNVDEIAPEDKGEPENSTGQNPAGKILTVWGAYGAPGRTTLAVNLAGLAADSGLKVCLVDADTYGASVGAVLGLSDEYSSLAQLCHYADRGNLRPETVEELVSTIDHKGNQLDVITGINRPDRWTEVRGKALAEVFGVLRRLYDVIIVDTSFCIEQDETLAFDGLAPLRNDGTLTSIFEADHILIVGLADVVGVPRTVKALENLSNVLADTMIDVPRSVYFNRVRSESVGASPAVALEHAWQRFGPALPIAGYITEDRAAVDKSWLAGKTVMEAAPKSKIAQDFTAIFKHLLKQLDIQQGGRENAPTSNGLRDANMVEKKGKGFFSQLFNR